MVKLRVVTWNAEGMFARYSGSDYNDAKYKTLQTKRAGAKNAVAVVRELDADIITIPESGTFGKMTKNTRTSLEKMGYTVHEFTYNDEYRPPIAMMVLTRLPAVSEATYRLGERRSVGSVVVQAGGTQIRVIAVHLDDKTEAQRLKEVADLATIVNAQITPVIAMGDFNAMRADDWFARVVRSGVFRALTRFVKWQKLRYILERLSQMGKGQVVAQFARQTQLRDLDPGLARTITPKNRGLEWMPSIRLAKIDWIFATPGISAHSYRVYRDVGSDHRPVIADIDLR